MQTYSHLIVAAGIENWVRRRRRAEGKTAAAQVNRKALFIGSVAPDVPLILLSIVTIVADIARRAGAESGTSWTQQLFEEWFFTHPGVIVAHNTLQSPFVLAVLLATSLLGRRRRWANWLLWFTIGCTAHTAADILLHHGDGPLLLFPFEWSVRFNSPISYWNPDYHGIPWTIFEHTVDVILVIILLRDWRQLKIKRMNG